MVADPFLDFVATSRREGPRAVVCFAGELDCANEGLARAELEIALDRGGDELILDLRDLTFMDARGIHVLLDARSACRARQRRLLVVPAPERVQRVLAVCCVDERFERLEPSTHPPRLVA